MNSKETSSSQVNEYRYDSEVNSHFLTSVPKYSTNPTVAIGEERST